MGFEILACQKSTLEYTLCKKSTKMHWYDYNNSVALLNIAKSQIFYPVYNLKILKFSTILYASLCAIRPGGTSALAPNFSHKKGNPI